MMASRTGRVGGGGERRLQRRPNFHRRRRSLRDLDRGRGGQLQRLCGQLRNCGYQGDGGPAAKCGKAQQPRRRGAGWRRKLVHRGRGKQRDPQSGYERKHQHRGGEQRAVRRIFRRWRTGHQRRTVRSRRNRTGRAGNLYIADTRQQPNPQSGPGGNHHDRRGLGHTELQRRRRRGHERGVEFPIGVRADSDGKPIHRGQRQQRRPESGPDRKNHDGGREFWVGLGL